MITNSFANSDFFYISNKINTKAAPLTSTKVNLFLNSTKRKFLKNLSRIYILALQNLPESYFDLNPNKV